MATQSVVAHYNSGIRTVVEAVLSDPEPPYDDIARYRPGRGWTDGA